MTEVTNIKGPAPEAAEKAPDAPAPSSMVQNVFKNIVELLKHGQFFGHNAGYVAEAIGFLEANIKANTPKEPEA